MSTRVPTQSSYSNQPANPESAGRFDTPEVQSADLDLIRQQAELAYVDVERAQRGDLLTLGARAASVTPEVGTAADYAIEFELTELTLKQLGHNIERMRADAVNKAVNPALGDGFIPRRAATASKPASFRNRDGLGSIDDYRLAS